jgi:hypothetical protein
LAGGLGRLPGASLRKHKTWSKWRQRSTKHNFFKPNLNRFLYYSSTLHRILISMPTRLADILMRNENRPFYLPIFAQKLLGVGRWALPRQGCHGWPSSLDQRNVMRLAMFGIHRTKINSPLLRLVQSDRPRKEFARFFNSAVVRQHSGGRTTWNHSPSLSYLATQIRKRD